MTSNAKYTPGPWKAGTKSVSAPETDDRLGLDIRIYGGNAGDNRANARLIAAAPDLLNALQLARSVLVDLVGYQPDGDAVTMIDAAIRKATGAAA